AKQLGRWEDELDDFQRRARELEQKAEDAQAAIDAAKGRAGKTRDDCDPNGEGCHRGIARKAPSRADRAVENAQADLDKVIAKAKQLAEEHESRALERAARIRDATKRLAPHEPGWFDSALDWLGENLPDILSAVAGVIGLVAIVFSGPLGLAMVAALMLTASALSAGALALRVFGDAELRASLWDGFSRHEFDTDFWSNLVTVGGDVLGMLPGLGAVWKGGMETLRAASQAEEALTLGRLATRFGAAGWEQARAVATLDNALLTFTVRGARAAPSIRTIEVGSASLGVGTAGFGLANSVLDADDDGIKDGAVAGIDGARSAVDMGAVFELVQHLRS
ncbi:hypothetical protein ABT301_30345, partial [Streptomyces sp. NPDC000987]|uniref:hypothetical protein n=1 Tax=Streptomyces sp. NPDC000987 TaxID=3154374 RepID=UPI0033293967